jgi:hypothetical protein
VVLVRRLQRWQRAAWQRQPLRALVGYDARRGALGTLRTAYCNAVIIPLGFQALRLPVITGNVPRPNLHHRLLGNVRLRPGDMPALTEQSSGMFQP